MNLENKNSFVEEIKTVDLGELLKVLWARKFWIAAAMALAFFVSGLILILKPSVYEPQVLLQVNNASDTSSSGLAGVFSSMAGGGLGGAAPQEASPAQIEMTLMQSNYILEPTMRKLNLDVTVTPKYFPIIGPYFARHYKSEGIAPAKLGLSSYAWGGESWSLGYFVTPVSEYKEKFKLVAATDGRYQLFDPDGSLLLSGRVGVAAESKAGDVRILIHSLHARPGTVFYLKKYSSIATLASLHESLEVSELSPGSKSGGSIDTGIVQLSLKSTQPAKASAVLNTIASLIFEDSQQQKKLSNTNTLHFIKKQLPIMEKRLKLAQVKLNAEQARSGVIDLQGQAQMLMQEATALNQQLAAATVTQAQYRESYTNANPVMAGINAQVASLKNQKHQLERKIATLPMRDQEVMALMQDVQVQQQIYTAFLSSEQQYSLLNASTLSDVRVLNPASPPDQALPKYAMLLLIASLFFGLVLSSLVILVLHQFKNFIFDPYWAEKEFGIRTAGVLPYSQNQVDAKKAFDEGQKRSIEILAATKPDDPCVEAIRSLRTSLFFALKDKQTNVVNITGAVPATGKSFISVNLAVGMAQMNKRVVLIDADMRRGYLNRYFKKSHAPGLSEILNEVAPLEKVIHTTAVEGLDFIAAGLYPDNPSELLLRDGFKHLIETLSKNYDVVIIDSPPILAVNDASVIAKASPVNYLVIPAGMLKGKEIETAVKRFYNDGISLTGTLFNFVKKGAERISSHAYQNKYTSYYKKATEQQSNTSSTLK